MNKKENDINILYPGDYVPVADAEAVKSLYVGMPSEDAEKLLGSVGASIDTGRMICQWRLTDGNVLLIEYQWTNSLSGDLVIAAIWVEEKETSE